MLSVRVVLSHGGLRKGNPDSKVITGFYRSPGIAGGNCASFVQSRDEEGTRQIKKLRLFPSFLTTRPISSYVFKESVYT